jgi:AcrR family transcriptional regulator
MTRSRPYHHGNLRDALLDAAERSIEDLGVEQLSLRELARTVGVSHAAPRAHFPERRALLEALAERGFARLDAELRSADQASAPTFDARLRATMAAYVAFARRNPALLDLMFSIKVRSDAAGLQSAAADALSAIPRLIGDGMTAGVLAPADPTRNVLLLAATIRGIVGLVTNNLIDPDAIGELIADATTTFVRGNAPAGL